MLASLLRPKKRRVYAERSPFSSPYTAREAPVCRDQHPPHHTAIRFNGLSDDEHDDGDVDDDNDYGAGENYEDAEDEDEANESTPLLPIFSASHLGMEVLSRSLGSSHKNL